MKYYSFNSSHSNSTSAGVGRTGTFIALDVILHQLNNQDYIDIFNVVHSMRKNRNNMVQVEAQYIFIHQCMLQVGISAHVSENLQYGMS